VLGLFVRAGSTREVLENVALGAGVGLVVGAVIGFGL
jgi:hypothetical protein